MPLDTKQIRLLVLQDIEHKCPFYVFEVEWRRRKHLTTADIDETRTPKEVMSVFEIVYKPNTERPRYPTPEDYKVEALKNLYQRYSTRSKHKFNVGTVSRMSKKKDKSTGNWVRVFHVYTLLDHDVYVVSDPEDETILEIRYVDDDRCDFDKNRLDSRV